jgi:Ca2+-transporting ATPase
VSAGRLFSVSGSGYEPSGSILDGELSDERPDSERHVGIDGDPALHALLTAGVLCNDSKLVQEDGRWAVRGSPTEGALLAVASKASLDRSAIEEEQPRLDTVPFESQFGYMATLNRQTEGARIFVKGGAEVVLERCGDALGADGRAGRLDEDVVLAQVENLAGRGLRVLALATKEWGAETTDIDHKDLTGLTFLGLQGIIDPPRAEAIDAVATCFRAGIRVKMITGDHAVTAAAIARQIGIVPDSDDAMDVLRGRELARLTDGELIDIVESMEVFARVSPEQKLRLVEALQHRGHVVAMTGDGVNDAPALKQADIGTAMGIAGTDVATEAADIVLTDDNFATIEAAVEEGRGVFDNLKKFITWTLPTNLGEGLVILVAVFLGTTLPILPVQILWVNMTTAVLLGMMLAFEPKEAGIMERPPRDPSTPILTGTLIQRLLLVAALLLVGAYGLFEWTAREGYSDALGRTVAVNVFVFVELFYLFNCRSLTRSYFRLPQFSNRWLLIGVAGMVLLQLAFTYVPFMNTLFGTEPLAAWMWLPILGLGLATFFIVELAKAFERRRATGSPQSALSER